MRYTTAALAFLFLLLSFFLSCAAARPAHYTAVVESSSSLGRDISRASTDGPFVFYRAGKIVVKSVVMQDTVAKLQKATYNHKNEILLTCKVPATGDAFSFGLRDSISMPPAEYPALPASIFVLSDIEGNFKALKTLLQGANVVNDRFEWSFGKNHLVLLGDFFDRGTEVTECLWLLYKLETEAAENGGGLHFILGNHEVMNMSGDQRYVRNKYFENAELIGEEYGTWYAANTELGQWLRSRNAVEKIGGYLFCHGGIHSDLATSRMNLQDINRIARRWYGTPEAKITDSDAALIFNSYRGIFWYRDMAKNKLNTDEVEGIAAHFDAKKIILGHTLQPEVRAFYNGRVVCTDLYHEENLRTGTLRTLLIEDGLFYCLFANGTKNPVMSIKPRTTE